MENLKNNEQDSGTNSASEWDSLGKDVEFMGSRRHVEHERSIDKVLREEKYVNDAKDQEAYRLGLDSGDNADKLAAMRQNIEALYHMGNDKGAESELAKVSALENDKIIPDGKDKLLDGNTEDSTITRGAATEIISRAEFNAAEFAKENVTVRNASDVLIQERTKYNSLKRRYDKWHSPDYKEPKGFFEKRAHKKFVKETMEELARYGFDPSRRHDSLETKVYDSHSNNSVAALDFGRQRASDYSELSTLTSGKHSGSVLKALKKGGFKELPKSWSDKNFTTHEIATMNWIARNAIRSLTYK